VVGPGGKAQGGRRACAAGLARRAAARRARCGQRTAKEVDDGGGEERHVGRAVSGADLEQEVEGVACRESFSDEGLQAGDLRTGLQARQSSLRQRTAHSLEPAVKKKD
jgi:hypothetical protein